MILRTLLIISFLVLAGCRHDVCPEPEPVVITEVVYMTCGTPPQRDKVELRPVAWQVGKDGRFSLSAEGYEDLGYNISEIWNGVEQLVIEIGFYEQCLRENTSSGSARPQSSQESSITP